jgi:hypothetical protein
MSLYTLHSQQVLEKIEVQQTIKQKQHSFLSVVVFRRHIYTSTEEEPLKGANRYRQRNRKDGDSFERMMHRTLR